MTPTSIMEHNKDIVLGDVNICRHSYKIRQYATVASWRKEGPASFETLSSIPNSSFKAGDSVLWECGGCL